MSDVFEQIMDGFEEFALITHNTKALNKINMYRDLSKQGLLEDTVKTSDGKWTNKGKDGTHGKFKTKKEADAQRKAMFANGYSESLTEDFQLNAQGYVLLDRTKNKKVSVYYNDKVTRYFCMDMVLFAITDYVEKYDYFIEEVNAYVFYIFNESNESLKIQFDFSDIQPSVLITCDGDSTVYESVRKDFTTYKDAVSAIIECFDMFVKTGHLKETGETDKADAEKVKTLKLMHGVMMSMNNENAYDSWIVSGVPDGASEDDYEFISLDAKEYNDTVNLFNKIFKRYAKDGLFKPSQEEAMFAKNKCAELNIPEIEILKENLNKSKKWCFDKVLNEKASPDGYAPEKTGKAYKVFRIKNGKLYPPMVANAGGQDTPVGVWLDAEEGEFAGLSKTGRQQVKSIGSGTLAYRPGWHLGDVPRAPQFDRMNKETGEMEFPKDFVWAECDYAMDVDYQPEADEMGYMRTKVDDEGNVTTYKSDKYQHSLAGLKKLPSNGYYKYRTNPRPDTVPWVITGQMKVNRLLSDDEVNEILKSKGIAPIHRQGGDKTLAELGLGAVSEAVENPDKKNNVCPDCGAILVKDATGFHCPRCDKQNEDYSDGVGLNSTQQIRKQVIDILNKNNLPLAARKNKTGYYFSFGSKYSSKRADWGFVKIEYSPEQDAKDKLLELKSILESNGLSAKLDEYHNGTYSLSVKPMVNEDFKDPDKMSKKDRKAYYAKQRNMWERNPATKVKQSGKAYKRNKKVDIEESTMRDNFNRDDFEPSMPNDGFIYDDSDVDSLGRLPF